MYWESVTAPAELYLEITFLIGFFVFMRCTFVGVDYLKYAGSFLLLKV
jgi:hypothetical protein